jgi:hypothetical protein
MRTADRANSGENTGGGEGSVDGVFAPPETVSPFTRSFPS